MVTHWLELPLLRNSRTIVLDILFEKDVISSLPRGEDGSAVKIMSANTKAKGAKPLAYLASLIIWPPFLVS